MVHPGVLRSASGVLQVPAGRSRRTDRTARRSSGGRRSRLGERMGSRQSGRAEPGEQAFPNGRRTDVVEQCAGPPLTRHRGPHGLGGRRVSQQPQPPGPDSAASAHRAVPACRARAAAARQRPEPAGPYRGRLPAQTPYDLAPHRGKVAGACHRRGCPTIVNPAASGHTCTWPLPANRGQVAAHVPRAPYM